MYKITKNLVKQNDFHKNYRTHEVFIVFLVFLVWWTIQFQSATEESPRPEKLEKAEKHKNLRFLVIVLKNIRFYHVFGDFDKKRKVFLVWETIQSRSEIQ